MQAAHNMDFTDGVGQTLFDFGENLLQTHLVGQRVAGLFPEGAEFAPINADIGIIDMLIDDVIGFIAVPPLPDDVGQIAHAQQIGAAIQGQAILKGKTLLGHNFLVKRY